MASRYRYALALGMFLLAVGVVVLMIKRGEEASRTEGLPAPCRSLVFERVEHIVCEVDLRRYEVALRLNGADGKAYGSLQALKEPFVFAMNAGMYHADMTPVGLYVEDSAERAPLNQADGEGNFFLKPNGVFFIDQAGRAGVEETGRFAAAGHLLDAATQSGPMLVIDGGIHPRFEPDGASRYIRNGVGVRADGTVVFAISRSVVSLGSFARLFRDELGCPNALFFDGAISALHDGQRYLVGGAFPVGPIAMVRERP